MRQNESYLFQQPMSMKDIVSSGNLSGGCMQPLCNTINSGKLIYMNKALGSKDQVDQRNLLSSRTQSGRPLSMRGHGKPFISSCSSNMLSMQKCFRPTSLSITGYGTESFVNKTGPVLATLGSSSDVVLKDFAAGSRTNGNALIGKEGPMRFRTKPNKGSAALSFNFPDPVLGASKAFMQRVAEMTSHETETIKLEKMKRTRKKRDYMSY